MATATPSAAPLVFTDQAKSLVTLRRAAQVAAGMLALLGAVKVVTGILMLLDNPVSALLGLVEGGLAVFLALILAKISTDLRFALEVPALSATHLVNALDSWRDFCKTLIGLAVVVFLGALIRFGG